MSAALQQGETTSNTIVSRAPGDGQVLGEVRCATPSEVAQIVERARVAQKKWQALGVHERNRVLNRLRGVLIDSADEIARVVSTENGKPRCEAVGLALPVCEAVKFYTRLAERASKGRRVSSTFFFGSKARVEFGPLGVAGFVLPWNFPFELGMKHMIPALAAGNAVIQKPSEQNPMIGELIGRLFDQAGFPEGLVNIVHGYAEVGQAIVDNVDVVCFVGSPGTGRRIMERAARRLIPVVLELGGNDAAIVRADADIDLTARGLISGTCFNSGQVCNGIERIYAHRSIAEPLVRRIVERVQELRQGCTGIYDVGPMAWPGQLATYEAHTQDAIDRGAKLEHGGTVERRGDGLFWPPTVLSNMTQEMRMMREETFGPFLAVMAVDSDEQAIELANDSDYGLGGSVWTRNVRAGEALARRIRAGSVMINNAVQSGGCVTLPFGGEGESGIGRVQGEEGFYNYVRRQSLMTCPRSVKDLWMPYHDGAEQMIRGLTRTLHGRGVGERVRGAVDFVRNFPWSER